MKSMNSSSRILFILSALACLCLCPGPTSFAATNSVQSVTLTPAAMTRGLSNSAGTVTLTAATSRTSAQRKIVLSSSNTSAATFPSSVTIATGATCVGTGGSQF